MRHRTCRFQAVFSQTEGYTRSTHTTVNTLMPAVTLGAPIGAYRAGVFLRVCISGLPERECGLMANQRNRVITG